MSPTFQDNHIVNLESDVSSSQPLIEEFPDIPDLLNCSYETLHHLASLSNHDDFIYA